MKCLTCKSETLQILDLGMQPFADSFYSSREAALSAELHPLQVKWCVGCELMQLGTETNPQERYNGVAYSYTSSNSAFAKRHWKEFASSSAAIGHHPRSVLEIGSNDGYLLSLLRAPGVNVQGIDASNRMVELANEAGIPTSQGIFGRSFAQSLDDRFDLIIANNVFNHADNPIDFLLGVAELLQPKGRFVFEVPALESMVQSGRYDQIYLEHITYWSARSLEMALPKAGMRLVGYEVVNYHGGSIRGVAELGEKKQPVNAPHAKEVSLEDLQNFSKFVEEHFARTRSTLTSLKKRSSGAIVGIGAAAKANTMINYLRLDEFLTFVTDASPEKIGKFTPKSALEIYPDSALQSKEVSAAVLLAWNLSNQLRSKIHELNAEVRIINL